MQRLAGGAPILIRRIRPDDKELLVRGLQGLSELSARRRFLTPKRRFTAAELRYLTEIDHHDHVALVAESPIQPVRSLIGVARFVRSPEDPTLAELAVVVGDDFQQQGLATALLTRLARAASERGVKRWRATMLTSNEPARRLVQGAAGRPVRAVHDGPVDELEFELVA